MCYVTMVDQTRKALPAGVIDLSDSMQTADRPVFRDLWHTNEYGANLVAEDLANRILPLLRAIQDGGTP